MIIFGSRGVRMKGGSGSFYCPQCGGTRQYTHQKMRRFFTLYFIPIIPLDVIGEYIECNYCKGTFKPAVLEYDPRQEQRRVETQIRTTVRRALLSVLVADGVPGDAPRDAALDVMKKLTGDASMTRAEIDTMVETAAKRPIDATSDVQAVAEQLDYPAREVFLRAAMSIAAADGAVSSNEERQIRALAKAAGITDAHLAGIMATSPRLPDAPLALPS